MRRKDDTLREMLLDFARQITDTEGIEAVNIRTLARKAGVATGTVYNYFSNKDEILFALTEEYWQQTFFEMKTVITDRSFCEQLQEIFLFLKERINQSAGKLMNSLGDMETVGQARMASMQSTLEAVLIQCMERDAHIRRDIWDETFTKERFVRFIVGNIMISLKAQEPDITFFLIMIRRTIY